MKTIISIIIASATTISAFSQAIAERSQKDLGEVILAEYNGAVGSEMVEYNMLIDEGVSKDADEDFKGAIECFDQAIALNANNPKAFDLRGVSNLKLLRYQRAYKDFERAIELDQNYAEAYNHRGITNYCLQRYYYAVEDYTRAIELDEKYAKAYFNRGLVYVAFEEYRMAYADLKIALDLGYFEAKEVIEKYCGGAGNDFAKN
ncbi:MAG: tetratricopeptide repeat protein [Bacteroidales bacterium]|nr:tetratricopeptide repeat protein [Bacteroidales bacterium]